MEQPTGDAKNWTWVLERPCPECEFDAASIDRDDLGPLIRANAAAWRALLSRGAIVSQRPPTLPGDDVVWSGLEYGAHVRDVYKLFYDRVVQVLKKKTPTFDDWNQNEAAIEGRYHELEAAQVSYDLARVAGEMADAVDRVSGPDWERTGLRSDGASFTLQALVTYLLHDVSHHLADVERGYEAMTEA